MNSIYSILLEVPIFKGITEEQLSQFIERTPLEFTRYKAGERIVSTDDICKTVKCVVSGDVRIEQLIYTERIVISETISVGNVIGIEHLFGLDNHYNIDVYAEHDCGIMEFSKEDFLQLIMRERICQINYLNYLALRAQRPRGIMSTNYGDSFIAILAYMVKLCTEGQAERIDIKGVSDDLLTLLRVNKDHSEWQLSELQAGGLLKVHTPRHFEIPSRRAFLSIVDLHVNKSLRE